MSAVVHIGESGTAALKLRMHLLATLVGRYAYRYRDEVHLHSVIEKTLRDAGESAFEREYTIDSKNRFDFWYPNEGLVLEVKVDGSLGAALRQVDRYTQLEAVKGVLLLSTCRWTEVDISHLHGKPVRLQTLQRQWL
jgi:hypothetical protein